MELRLREQSYLRALTRYKVKPSVGLKKSPPSLRAVANTALVQVVFFFSPNLAPLKPYG